MLPGQDPVRILIVLENPAIDGVGKPMLEFAAQATAHPSIQRAGTESPSIPGLDISFAVFSRRAIAEDNTLARLANACGVSVYEIDERHVFDLRVIAKLIAAVRKSKADIVLTNGAKTHVVMRIARFFLRTGRWVAFHHGYTSTSAKVLVYNKIGLWSLRRAERVLTSCAAFATQLELQGVSPSRLRVQHMPIRPFAPVPAAVAEELRRQLKIAEETLLIVCVGRLSKEKGQTDLIQAVARLKRQAFEPSFCLVIVGDGPDKTSLSQLSQTLGVSELVRFVGFQQNVNHYLGIANLFVLPSHSEGCPNALLEAMAAGVPVVATSVGGVPEIAENERDALLVESQDVAGMATAIARILSDKQLGARLAASARSVLESHAPEHYFRSMVRNLGL